MLGKLPHQAFPGWQQRQEVLGPKKLKDEGFKVVSTYVGKDESAQAYSKQSGIEVIKSDVSYFESCKAAVAEVEKKIWRY